MNYLRDTGFVIKRINFGEADRYITLFTANHGKIEVVAKGVRKITSRRASHIELLNLINFQAVKGNKNNILTEVQVLDSFEKQKDNLKNISSLFLICELLDKLCPLGQQHKDIYDMLFEFVMIVDEESIDIKLFNFQVNLLSMLGFWNRDKEFQNEKELRNFIEGVLERRIKTKIYT